MSSRSHRYGATNTFEHVQADPLPRTLDVEPERENNTLVIDTQTSPTSTEQVSGGLGAQGTTVLDRVYDPSPIPHDQPGKLAKETTTTDTISGQWTRGVADVRPDKTGEPLAAKFWLGVGTFRRIGLRCTDAGTVN